jgi:Flp pilus assembly protein TadD
LGEALRIRIRNALLQAAFTSADGHRRGTLLLASLVCLGLFDACRTTEDMQRDYAQTLTPKKLEVPDTPDTETPKEVREYKVRVYADADYQRQTLLWSEGIEAQIARANRVLEAQFGVRLVVKELKSWRRSGHSDSLDAALNELVELDAATDVDWVLGFVSSLEVFAANQEQLGRAESPGHHMVLRGMFSLAEVNALNSTLNELSQQERDNVTRERRLHKQTLVLLHELAHSLGAFHELSGDWIMSPYYDAKQSSFSPASLHLILASLTYWRATDPAGRQAWARSYRDEVTRFPPAEADRASLGVALAYSAKLLASSTPDSPTDPAPAHAETASRGRSQSSDPLLESCYVAQARSPRADATLATCRRAVAAPGARSEALLLLGRVLVARKQVAEAVEVLAHAEAELSAGAPEPKAWVYLAQLYARSDTCTGAERAAKRAPDDPAALQVVKDCTQQRRSVALPRDVKGVPVEREHDYVEAIQKAQRDVDARHTEQVRVRVLEMEKAFPGSPGPPLIACISAGGEKDATQTRTSCTAAIAAAPEAFVAWLLLGKVAISESRWEDAGKCLQRAIELDDNIGEAWRRLAAVYIHVGDRPALTALRSRYRQKFKGDLSPTP